MRDTEEVSMLARREHLKWSLKDHKDRDYASEAERRFFEKIENAPEPTEKLKEIVREYGKYAR
jgi:hypothetical protein